MADADKNHIETVRKHLLEQMKALREAPRGDELKTELDRSKGLAELASAVVASAKVEVDYIVAVKGAAVSSFLQEPDGDGEPPRIPSAPVSPLPSVEDPVLSGGPKSGHPWKSSVHRLKG